MKFTIVTDYNTSTGPEPAEIINAPHSSDDTTTEFVGNITWIATIEVHNGTLILEGLCPTKIEGELIENSFGLNAEDHTEAFKLDSEVDEWKFIGDFECFPLAPSKLGTGQITFGIGYLTIDFRNKAVCIEF